MSLVSYHFWLKKSIERCSASFVYSVYDTLSHNCKSAWFLPLEPFCILSSSFTMKIIIGLNAICWGKICHAHPFYCTVLFSNDIVNNGRNINISYKCWSSSSIQLNENSPHLSFIAHPNMWPSSALYQTAPAHTADNYVLYIVFKYTSRIVAWWL